MGKSKEEKKKIIFDKLREEVQNWSVEILYNILLSEEISDKAKKIIFDKVISFIEKGREFAYLSLLLKESNGVDDTPVSTSSVVSTDWSNPVDIWSSEARDTGWPEYLELGSLNSNISRENSI